MKLVTILDVFENEGLVLTRDQWNLVTTRDPKSICCHPQASPPGLQWLYLLRNTVSFGKQAFYKTQYSILCCLFFTLVKVGHIIA